LTTGRDDPAVSFLLVAVGLLAHARATRLITTDQITAGLRTRVVRRVGAAHALAYLVHCRWCVGLWLSAPAAAVVTAAAHLPHPLLTGPLLALAYSHATGLLTRAEDDE
jgi:hypothetical protein